MLSIQSCRDILEVGGKKYSDNQIKTLRALLYQLGEIDYNNFKDSFKNAKKSNHIYSCFN